MSLIPRIAIIGAGYSGLATAVYLLQLNRPLQITLFDPQGIGGEASKISAGILQKYAGLRATLNRFGNESEKEALHLISLVEKTLNKSVVLSRGVLRQALTEAQQKDYALCAQNFDDVRWLEAKECQKLDPLLPPYPGIFIDSGVTIDTGLYLEGLYRTALQGGLVHQEKRINSFSDLKDFDVIICATGALSSEIPEFKSLRIHPVKGQLLELSWPKNIPPLHFSLVSQVYITMHKDNTRCLVGATYEHTFDNPSPDWDKAVGELMPKAWELYPPLKDSEVLEVKAGLRASSPTRLPVIKNVQDNLWIYTGLGSKGMIYHAYYAKMLVDQVKKKIY